MASVFASECGMAKLTDCGDGGDDLAKLELVENRGLTGGVETNLEDT